MLSNGGHIGQSEIVLQATLKSAEDVAKYARGRAIVLSAGALGESIELGQVKRVDAVKIFKEPGAAQDYAKYREMVYLLRSMQHEATEDEKVLATQLEELDGKIWDDAMKLVSDERALIVELAKLLASKYVRENEFVELPISEIDALDSIKKRFGSGSA